MCELLYLTNIWTISSSRSFIAGSENENESENEKENKNKNKLSRKNKERNRIATRNRNVVYQIEKDFQH